MSLFGKRSPRPPRPEIVGELRGYARNLTGWTVTGNGQPRRLTSVLFDAADEIESLLAAAGVSTGKDEPK